MARLARLYVQGQPQLLVQRGNNRQAIFIDDEDRLQFLAWLGEATQAHHVAVHAYVLMPDHFHLLATPQTETAIPRVLQAIGRRYVAWFNRRHQRSGTLWHGRYRSTVLAPTYVLSGCRYVESNPTRSGMVADPSAYRWSSAAHHVGLRVDSLVTDHALIWALGNTPFERQAAYRALLSEPLAAQELHVIRSAMQTGWLLESPELLAAWTDRTNRRHQAMSRGRRATNSKHDDSGPH